MTQLVDKCLQNPTGFENLSHSTTDPQPWLRFHRAKNYQYQTKKHSSICSFILHSPIQSVSLYFHVKMTAVFSLVIINLLDLQGNAIKVNCQMSRNHLIKSLCQSDDAIKPYITPATGEVYFRIGYALGSMVRGYEKPNILSTILNMLDIQKIYLAIRTYLPNIIQTNIRIQRKISDSSILQTSKAVSLSYEQNPQKTKFDQTVDQKKEKIQNKLKVNQINKLLGQKKSEYFPFQPTKLKKSLLDLGEKKVSLPVLTKRKSNRGNFQRLIVSNNTQKQIKQIVFDMMRTKCSQHSIKVVDCELGKITLNFYKQDQHVYKQKVALLSMMGRNSQYHFIDRYFKNDHNVPITIMLSLKEDPLLRFLQANKMSISFETKLRILLQLACAVNTLWEEKKVILNISNMKKIHITKNLTVKLRGLSFYSKVEPHMLFEEKQLVNKKITDTFLSMSQIYSMVFYRQPFIYFRPSKQRSAQSSLTDYHQKSNFMGKLVQENLLQKGKNSHIPFVLTGLNYIFSSYIDQTIKVYENKKAQLVKQYYSLTQTGQLVSETIKDDESLLTFRYLCCWLYKVFEKIAAKDSPIMMGS